MAAGYSDQDFAVFELDRSAAQRLFRAKLDQWHELSHGERSSPLRDDPAVAGVLPRTPLLALTGGPKTAAFAARRGFGLMLPPQGQDLSGNQAAMNSYIAADRGQHYPRPGPLLVLNVGLTMNWVGVARAFMREVRRRSSRGHASARIAVLSSHMTDQGERSYPQFVFTASGERPMGQISTGARVL